jgi:predicted nuclease of predicted toxin-antitoxin system
VKLYVDESVSVALATILAQHGIDCLTARDAGHLGQSDEFQLRVATETERTIFTHDTRDFIHLANKWQAAGRHHSGILLCHFMPLRQLSRRFQIFLLQPPPTSFADQIVWLPPA